MGVGQTVQAILTHAVILFQAIRAVVVGIDHATIGTGAGEHFAHQLAVPGLGHQLGLGYRRGGGIADDGNEVINVGQGDG